MPASMTVWTVTPASEYLQDIRADLDNYFGTPLDYVGTVDGAWTLSAAEWSFRVDQAAAYAIADSMVATASPESLIARRIDSGVPPRPATFTRITVIKEGIGLVAINAIVTGLASIQPPYGPAISDPISQWKVIDNDAGNTADGAVYTLESVVAGDVSVTTQTRFALATPVPGVADFLYSEALGMTTQLGRPAETPAELRISLASPRGSPSSITGLREAILRLPWVVAASITGAAGVVTVTVAPGPIGTDQETALAETLLGYLAAGITTTGTSSITINGPDGSPITYYWNEGVTEPVDIELLSPQYDGSVPSVQVLAAVRDQISAEFAKLKPGDPARFQRIYASTVTPGLTGISITMNGGIADVFPTNSAATLIPNFI